MSMFDHLRLIIYRIKEKGLEIFLVNAGEHWEFPEMQHPLEPHAHSSNLIELDPLDNAEDGKRESAVAIEGDWHDIPSLKKLLREDVDLLKDQLSRIAPGLEQGSFFDISEALRKITPDSNAFIKELKEILRDRNSIKYM